VFTYRHVAYDCSGLLDVMVQYSSPNCLHKLEHLNLAMWHMRAVVYHTCWPYILVLFINPNLSVHTVSPNVAHESHGQQDVLVHYSSPFYHHRLECPYFVMWPMRAVVNLTLWPSILVLFIISGWSVHISSCGL